MILLKVFAQGRPVASAATKRMSMNCRPQAVLLSRCVLTLHQSVLIAGA